MLKVIRKGIGMLFWLAVALLALLVAARLYVLLATRSMVYSPDEIEARRVAIVFGAGLRHDGSPTPILRDRVAAAADLYFQGKAEKLLMSGDNRFVDYNEPEAMRQYALSLGVPDEAIVLDYAGRRTYDTCYRARAIFGVQEAILVTQKFHLPRALYLCSHLGVDAIGATADRQYYRKLSRLFWNTRELFATFTALLDVHIFHPLPVLGKPEPIFPDRRRSESP